MQWYHRTFHHTRVAKAVAGLALAFLMLIAAGVLNGSRADGTPKAGRIASTETAAPARAWTGCYAGVNLGYAIESTGIAGISFDAKDVAYGVGAGCDFELAGMNVVLGAMADIDWTKADSPITSFNHSWFVGARAGVLVSHNLLAYVLAGYTSVDGSTVLPVSVDNKGLTFGGGLEFKIADKWHLNAEFRQVDLGDDAGGMVEHSQQSGRIGLKYRF